MPRVFRPNSTIKQPVYKPKNVDMLRNKDTSCTVCIPFTADVTMGTDDLVCSIDALSLLTGSDTFNKFAQVFDEFKIQKYHCCIDLTKPQTSNLDTTIVMTPLDWNGPWNQFFIVSDGNNQMNASNAQFFNQLQICLQRTGIITPNGQGGFDRNYTQNTTGQSYYILEILYQLFQRNHVAVKMDGMYRLFDNQHYNFRDDAAQLGQVTFQLNGNPQMLNIAQKLPNYQMIGAAALRQVPKGFYGAVSSDQRHQNNELPDYYQFNDINAQRVMEYDIVNEEIESIGNYIHDSYLPGSSVHLSLEVNGTSATEKSLYLPTNIISDIAQVDSFNQLGRFIPVGLLQNKVKEVEGRDIVANGVFFEEHVRKVEELMHQQNNNINLIRIDFAIGIVGVDGSFWTVTIPFFTAPLRVDINNQLLVVPDGPYTVIGYEGKNGGRFDINGILLNYQTFEQFVYEDVAGGSLIYNSASDNDCSLGNDGSSFSLQCYITVRFRNVRNMLTNFVINYPYCICNIKNENLEIWNPQVNPIRLDHTVNGHNRGLVKMTMGIKASNNQFIPIADMIDVDLKIIRAVWLDRNVQGFICHKFINVNTANPFTYIDDQNQHYDASHYVLYGMAVQMNPRYRQYCFKFNYLSLGDRHNLTQWLGVRPPADMCFHLVFVAVDFPVYDNNIVNPGYVVAPHVPQNGNLRCMDWTKIYWGFDLSRMRSYGICDGISNNNVLEVDCSPGLLTDLANCIPDLAGNGTAHFSFVPLGVRVGSPWCPVQYPQI